MAVDNYQLVVCTTCNQEKPRNCFYPRGKVGDIRSQCMVCTKATNKQWREQHPNFSTEWRRAHPIQYKLLRRNHLRRRYGMSLDDYDAMVTAQSNQCACCGQFMKTPCVDHDHTTGLVRALLCVGCNIRVGWYEQVETAKAGILTYLEQYRG